MSEEILGKPKRIYVNHYGQLVIMSVFQVVQDAQGEKPSARWLVTSRSWIHFSGPLRGSEVQGEVQGGVTFQGIRDCICIWQ